MNRCFDDVERFVLRLKQSARALQELAHRKKHSKNKRFGGMQQGNIVSRL